MKKSNALFLTVVLLFMLHSCSVEFSPNAPWREVPVIYCILDQDDEYTWARVEKCFLGEDDIRTYGGISDSLNYPEGSIVVSLHGFDGDGNQTDSIAFQYVKVTRDSGDFAYEEQPAYRAYTAGLLRESRTYKLRVHRTADGYLLAESDAVGLIEKVNESVFTTPAIPYGKFGFGSDGLFKMEWKALRNARLYMPVIRFYYEADGDTLYADFNCMRTRATTATYSRDVFLADLKQQFADDTLRRKTYTREADLFLTACSEELYAYLNTIGNGNNIEDARQVYSNINGGVGIVASRRTHLKKTVAVEEGTEVGRGLGWFITNLGINMH